MRLLKQKGSPPEETVPREDGGKSLKYTIVAMEVHNYGNNLATVSCFFPLSKGKESSRSQTFLKKFEMVSKSKRRKKDSQGGRLW